MKYPLEIHLNKLQLQFPIKEADIVYAQILKGSVKEHINKYYAGVMPERTVDPEIEQEVSRVYHLGDILGSRIIYKEIGHLVDFYQLLEDSILLMLKRKYQENLSKQSTD